MLKVIEQGTHDGASIDHVIYMRDVFKALVGKKVVIYARSAAPLPGILQECNSNILHLVSEFHDTYIDGSQVTGIAESK